MLNQNHPDDERLSALASHDGDATDDTTLTAHVSSCDRCTEIVNELGALRSALADLPDLLPSRTLQLLPAVPSSEPAPDRVGGWVRRFFAPILASGAALALVGVIGTAAPALNGMQSAPGEAGHPSPAQEEVAAPAATEPESAEAAGGADRAGELAEASPGSNRNKAVVEPSERIETFATDGDMTADSATNQSGDEGARDALTTERSPWPMVLFAGIALMILAVAARWILAPRPG